MITRTIAALSLATLSASAQNWPQFRGPNGSGFAPDAKLPVEIAPGKNVGWKVSCPPGMSSPCIVGDRIFLTAFDGGKLLTLCYAKKDGKELWRAVAPAKSIEPFHFKEGSPAASTPAADEKRVVVYFGSSGLLAYDHDGKQLWHHELPVAQTNNNFGSGTSPILAGGLVVLVRDLSTDSHVLALDADTGKPAWKTDRPGMGTGYSTPIIWEHDGVKEIIAPGGLAMKAYDLKTGSERWIIRDLPAVNCASPVLAKGMLLFAGWSPAGEDAPMPAFDDLLKADTNKDGALTKPECEKTFLKDFFDSNDSNRDGTITRDEWDSMISYLKKGKNRLVAIKPGGSGDITDTHVAWEKKKGLPYVPTPIVIGGRIFMIKDGGIASLFEADTGKPIYDQQRIGIEGSLYASPVATATHIYLATLNGNFAVISAGEKPDVKSKSTFGERIAATPAISGGQLILRTASQLYSFGK